MNASTASVMARNTSPCQENLPRFLIITEITRMLRCSPRTVYRLASTGAMPHPVRLRGLVRWQQRVIQDWIAAGCPATDAG